MEWLSGWTYRKPITLSRSSGGVSNYQMKLKVGESSGAVGWDVHCNGHIFSAFNDLRFTNSNGITLLDYWIESITGVGPNRLATVWIEFDYIGSDSTNFYMYYGKTAAPAYSNGENTFLFFDHFEGSSLDGSKWTTMGSPTISLANSICDILVNNGAMEGIKGKTGFSTSAMRAKVKIEAPDWCYAGFYSLSAAQYALYGVLSASTEGVESYNGGAETTTFSIDNTAYNIIDVLYVNNTSQKYYENEALKATHTTRKMDKTDVAPRLYGWKDTDKPRLYADWVFVRQYLAAEPTWGSWQEEETEIIPSEFDFYKFGYINNPDWTPTPADPNVHSPCGYWYRKMKGIP